MSTLIAEGYDDYGPSNSNAAAVETLLNQGGWSYTASQTAVAIVGGLNGIAGQAIQLGAASLTGSIIGKTLAASYTRLIGGTRFSTNILGACGVQFTDNNTVQCSIVINPTSGLISVNQGQNGTVLQLGTAAVSANTTHVLEWDVTIGNATVGGWKVWLDGVQILNGTGLTQQSANNSAQVFQLCNYASASGIVTFDDTYLFSSSGSTNNAVLLSNPIVLTQWPQADHQTQFTNNGNVIGASFSTDTGISNIGANSLYLYPVEPAVACTINAIILNIPTSATGNNTAHLKGVIYSNSGSNTPNSLLSSGTQVTGFLPGEQITLPLTTAQALSANTVYWIGFICDSATPAAESVATDITGAVASNTYASGAPSTAPTMTYSQQGLYMFGLCTGATTNYESVDLNPPIGDQSSISSNTVGKTDLYVFPNIPTSIFAVYSVVVKGNARLTAPGTHEFDMEISSQGTLGSGNNTNIAPNLGYQGFESAFDTDPATGSAWTITNVNSAYCGVEIVT